VNLQIDLLSEKEITKLLQMIRAICWRMGLNNIMADKEIRELSQNISIESLSQTLDGRSPVDPRAVGAERVRLPPCAVTHRKPCAGASQPVKPPTTEPGRRPIPELANNATSRGVVWHRMHLGDR
jgi:hypothetical protein